MESEPIHLVFMVGAAVTVVWWLIVCFSASMPLVPTGEWRGILAATVPVNVAILLFVLTRWASWDVTGSPFYILSYLSLGLIWTYATVPWLGTFADIRLRQDVRGHNNVAAAFLIAALTIGTTLAYSGGNIGDGPGWWVVAFCAVLSTASVFAVAFLVAVLTDAEERITVDHDFGTAVRLGGAIVAAGLIAGRAVAGDWFSVGATMEDFFRTAWPIVLIAAVAVAIEKVMPPAYLASTLARSWLIGLAMVAGAFVYVRTLGPW